MAVPDSGDTPRRHPELASDNLYQIAGEAAELQEGKDA
jgi:hypothetical protein